MKKHLPLILSAIMVLSLFAAIAMARAEICPQCDQGTMHSWIGYDYQESKSPCTHGVNEYDYTIEKFRVYYTGCSVCSNNYEERRELVSVTVSCGKH